ncbi:hypothetical protein TWF694_006020 [Orbilia ellipsospora]|uniref:Uncharacterized protein n=1 Tax=Orbilia ellipsospora TaxID=2528407 RepID=A0AAV9WQY7_9PEZI
MHRQSLFLNLLLTLPRWISSYEILFLDKPTPPSDLDDYLWNRYNTVVECAQIPPNLTEDDFVDQVSLRIGVDEKILPKAMVFYYSEYHADPFYYKPGPPPCSRSNAMLVIKWHPTRNSIQIQAPSQTVLTHFSEIEEGSELWDKGKLVNLNAGDVMSWDVSSAKWQIYRDDIEVTVPEGGAASHLFGNDRLKYSNPVAIQEIREFAANYPEMWDGIVQQFKLVRDTYAVEKDTYIPIPPGLFAVYNENELEELGLPINVEKEIEMWNYIAEKRASPEGLGKTFPYVFYLLEGKKPGNFENYMNNLQADWEKVRMPPRPAIQSPVDLTGDAPSDPYAAVRAGVMANLDLIENYPLDKSLVGLDDNRLRGVMEELFPEMAADLALFADYPAEPINPEPWMVPEGVWSISNQITNGPNQLSLYSGASFTMEGGSPENDECDIEGDCLSKIEEEVVEDDVDIE